MRAKMNVKREQIASLRSVLKKNKSVAETALANLKQKYENEKAIVTDTLRNLRAELKMLKEDASTYTSIRAMFTEKHEEFVQQMDQLQQKLNVSCWILVHRYSEFLTLTYYKKKIGILSSALAGTNKKQSF